MKKIKDQILKETEECVFFFSSLKDTCSKENDIIERAFQFWQRMWTWEFKRLDKKMPNWSDEFYRHDYIGVLSYQGKILAMHLYGMQNLGISPCENSNYMLSNFTPEFAPTLREKGIERALSLNWFTVDIMLAKTFKDFPLIEVMGGLGGKVCELLSFDALIAAIRKDVSLAAKAQSLGMKTLGVKEVYGGPCDLCYTTLESRKYLDDKSKQLVDSLWEERIINENKEQFVDMNNLEKAVDHVMQKIQKLNGAQRPFVYQNFLAQTHYFVKHSVPLLEVAIEKSQNQEFILRSKEHIKEERGHEIMALRDLERMGADISQFSEWDWTRSFYERQYDLIQEEGELLMGYILALEWIAAKGKEQAKEIEQAFGKKTSKFVEVHAQEDQGHVQSAMQLVLKSKHREKIVENFFKTLEEYRVFCELLDQTDAGEQAA